MRGVILSGAELGKAMGEVVREYRGRGDRVGMLRTVMRDVGDELLAAALVADGSARVLGQLSDGSYAAILAPTSEAEVTAFACRIADEVSRSARETGLGPVQTFTAGMMGTRAWPTVGQLLEGSAVAMAMVRRMSSRTGIGPPRAAA